MLDGYKRTAENLRTIKIAYSKSQLYPNSTDALRPGQSIRIVFKGSETGNFDLANTKINFMLDITRFSGNNSLNAMVLSQSAADLFEVQNIQWNGIEMKHQRQRGGDQVFRKIKYMLQSQKHEISDHQQKHMDLQVPFGNFAVQGADVGILPLSQISYGSKAGHYISHLENSRLQNEMRRHYSVDYAAENKPIYKKRVDTTQKFYSVAIRDLCPELSDFTYIDSAMLSGNGIEIQLQLVNPDIAFTMLSRKQSSTAVTNADRQHYVFNSQDTYTISGHYLSIPTHDKKMNLEPLGFGLNKPTTYLTFAHQLFGVGAGIQQISNQWSVQHPSRVLGVMLIFTNSTLKTDFAAGDEMNMTLNTPTIANVDTSDYDCQFSADKLGYFSTNYFYPMQYSQLNLSVGQDTFPKQSSPPVASSQLQSWINSNDQCLQMWGKYYNTTLERFLSIDHVTFIAMGGKQLMQGELFQLNMALSGTQSHGDNLVCHAITVLLNTASFNDSIGFQIE